MRCFFLVVVIVCLMGMNLLLVKHAVRMDSQLVDLNERIDHLRWSMVTHTKILHDLNARIDAVHKEKIYCDDMGVCNLAAVIVPPKSWFW